jgi:hypothetical protein
MVTFDEAYEDADDIELMGYKGLFTNARVDRETLPEEWHAYDIRGGTDSDFSTLEESVTVDHTGTFLTKTEIQFPEATGYFTIDGDYNFY